MADGTGRQNRDDRRRKRGDFRTKPRSSPGSVIVILVSGVLVATAAASAIWGGGFSAATPHGRLLGTLETVAEAQESHHGATGRFATWERSLQVEVPSSVRLRILQGGTGQWEALAEAPDVGLSCTVSGRWQNGRHVRDQPVCYREDG